jgi:hypothetical protein
VGGDGLEGEIDVQVVLQPPQQGLQLWAAVTVLMIVRPGSTTGI